MKFEMISKDIKKRNLRPQLKLESFDEFFASELRSNKMLYVSDSLSTPPQHLTQLSVKDQKFKFRNILMNKIDSAYAVPTGLATFSLVN